MSFQDALPVPRLVSKPEELNELAASLQSEPRVAVDTESNSLHAYKEQVCLIQFSTPEADYLVDPITLPAVDALGPVFASASTEKIFHAAEYDLICLKRDFGFQFNNLFDTQVAARILGWKKVGLGNILEAQFGLKPNKRFQRADWKARPISDEMMRYAQLDTHYLFELRDRLERKLHASSMYELAQEDFALGCQVNGSAPAPVEQACWRVNGARELSLQQMAVLRELCIYRDRVARRLDRPLFKVISDRILVEIARHCPFDARELARVHGVQNWLLRKHGREILAAVRRGLESVPLESPRHKRPGAAFFNRMDAVRTWRKNTARKMGIESDVVLPRRLMEAVVRQNPQSPQDLSRVLAAVPWRTDRFGEQILEILQRVRSRR